MRLPVMLDIAMPNITDRKVLDFIIDKAGSRRAAVDVLGLGRAAEQPELSIRNWLQRGIPAHGRLLAWKWCRKHGLKLNEAWLMGAPRNSAKSNGAKRNGARNGGSNGRTGKGKPRQAKARRQAQGQGRRQRRAQQRQRRRRAAGDHRQVAA
jgi:hypothetical protein